MYKIINNFIMIGFQKYLLQSESEIIEGTLFQLSKGHTIRNFEVYKCLFDNK